MLELMFNYWAYTYFEVLSPNSREPGIGSVFININL